MKSNWHIWLVIAGLAICVCGRSVVGAGDPPKPAESLFQQALQADAAGNMAQRNQLLAEALPADPDFELARWYSGQVFYDGQWKTIDAVSRMVAGDPRWDEYQRRVEEADGTPAAHAELARWCHTQNLTYEERWHWFNVLVADPQNREALGRLGLRQYHGMLLSNEQIAAWEQQEKQAAQDLNRYSVQFEQSLRTGLGAGPAERQAAVKEIASVRDVAALPALLDTVFDNPKTDKLVLSKLGNAGGEKYLGELRQAVVAALSEMKQHEATLTLLSIAVDWPEEAIRMSAAQALRYRDKTSYMPYLMAELTAPIELAVSINVLPNGKVTVHEDLSESGPLVEHQHSQSSSYMTQYIRFITRDIPGTWDGQGKRMRGVSISQMWTDRARDYGNAQTQAAYAQEQVSDENALREERNRRIQEALQIATGEDKRTNAEAWWDSWKEYNELETPEKLPVYDTAEAVDYSHTYTQEFAYPAVPYAPYSPPIPPYVRARSCFAAGTPVWSQAGPVPIESVQVGDMVLSQDPVSGQLDYRPVTDKTVRPPSPTVNLNVGGESFIATRGHRFWVADQGWEMAKVLKPGQRLWSVSGSQHLDSVEPSVDIEAYNLDVEQFHTYFVGKSRLLVHDNNCPLPVTAKLPGVE